MKKILYLLVLLPMLFFGQTQTQNYVKTKTYKKASLVPLDAPTPDQAQVNITYLDGLGRSIQQISSQQSHAGNDIVTHIEYDNVGRQAKEYLPYASTQNTGNYITPATLLPNLVAQYQTNYGTINTNPFSEKELEVSPLNRVLKQAAPGNDWKLGSGHEIKSDYQTNAANEVKQYMAVTTWNASKGLYDITNFVNGSGYAYYPANQLYKTVTKDENWVASDLNNNTTEEFKDKEGRIILKRTYNAGDPHDTYYVYDTFGNLTYVLPPKTPQTYLYQNSSILNDLCYQYKYDSRNRLVEKKLPGKQWEFIVYDKLDRVVATGPASSPFSDNTATGWLITKYDVFSRPVYTGWMTGTAATAAGRTALQAAQDAATVLNESRQTTGTIDGIPAYYSNNVAPTVFKLLTVNYYDNYTFPSTPAIPIPSSIEGQTALTTSQVKGLLTASWTRVLTSSTAVLGETVATFYDSKARPIRTYTQNYLGGRTYTDTNLDFAGVPQYTVTYHRRLNGDTDIKTKEVFTYSSQGRLLTHTHQINTDTPQLMASNVYDNLGQLISKRVGHTAGMSSLQKVDFAYNIRGWLTEINKTAALTQLGDPKDLFAFKINYNTISTGITGVKALYNGNIAETYWNTADIQRAYGYTYDNLNRLTAAVFQKAAVTTSAYNETVSYDKNGNIMYLFRNGNSETATAIDNLIYSYGPNNSLNQLTKVADSSNKTLGFADSATNDVDDYSYDANGNMIMDKNKNITSITYNHLNLPTKIVFGTTGNIAYLYNATGQKVQKIVTIASPSSTTTTEYLGGYQYLGGVLQFFPTAEGYVEPITSSSFKYVFQYKDHLGNVRLSYKDISTTSTPSLQILEENNYYPFGLKHSGYGPAIVSTNQALKYKYNGKELQDDNIGGSQLNWYDYGAMLYDPAIGRRNNVDPLAETSRRWSPYSYCYNNPMRFVDPDGMQAQDIIVIGNKGQKLTYQNGNLLNSDGSAYTGKVDKFTQKTVDALATIGKSKEGAAMINELQSSSNEFTISKGDSEFDATDNNKAYANQLATDPAAKGSFDALTKMGIDMAGGSGGSITWEPSGGSIPTTDGMKTNATMDLGHEMSHALDSNRGMLDNRKENGVKRDEFQAVFRENTIRGQLNLPLRTHYQTTFDANEVKTGYGPSMLNSSNQNVKPSWYK